MISQLRPFPRTFVRLGVASLLGAVIAPDAAARQLTLRDAIGAALEAHPLVAVAAARREAAAEGAVVARAARLPGVAANATLVRFQEPMVVAPLHSFDPLNPPRFDEALVQGQLGLEYTLFDGGARGSRTRGADALADAAAFVERTTEQEVLEQTVSAYMTVLAARVILDAARARVDALAAERSRVEQNVGAGTAAEVDLLRATATLQQAVAERVTAEARVGLAERGLSRLTALPPERIVGRTLAEVAVRARDRPRESTLHPLLGRAARIVAAAEAGLDVERAAHLPRLTATAGMQDFGTLGGGHVAEWQAGMRLSWPLFTGGATRAQVRRAAAELTAARAEQSSTALSLAHEIDAAETAITEAEARLAALEVAVTQWLEVARIATLALDAGSGVQRDLLEAHAHLFLARAGRAQAHHDAVLARVRLAKALGSLDRTWIDDALETVR